MAIYRGTGGSTSTTEQATIDAVNEDAATATTKAAEASASATAAATSATSASSSATSAASSASTATTKASEASTSATNAATSASAASTSASAASTSASNAASSATTATTQAASATTSAANAAASETAAETAESNAEDFASDAQKSAYGAEDALQTLSDSSTLYSARHYAAKAEESYTNTSSTIDAAVATATAAAASSATDSANSATASANSATASANSATAAASSASAAQAAEDAALAALDSFDDRYLGVKTSDPTTDNDGNALVAGALYYNSTDDVMKVYEGSIWVAAYASLSGTLVAANNLSDVASVSAARTNLGLGTAATTASTDYVAVTGDTMTGNLDVTGTVTADGLTVDGSATINTSSTNLLNLNYIGDSKGSITTDGINLKHNATSNMHFNVNSADRLKIEGNGDISFYEDTGTTPKFFWDASAESLGIGTTSPAQTLDINGIAQIQTATGSTRKLRLKDSVSSEYFDIGVSISSGQPSFTVSDGADERMRIDSSGNVGIGTTSPVSSTGYTSLTLNNATNSGYLVLENNGTNKMDMYVSGGTEATLRGVGVPLSLQATGANVMTFDTNSSERMRIDSSGNVGIGTGSPTNLLHLDSGTGTTAWAKFENNTNYGYIGYDNADAWLFYNGTTERMRIDSSGNVGIGTSSPSSYLEVVGSGVANSTIARIKGGSATGNRGIDISNDASGNVEIQAIRASDNSTGYQLTINPDGGNVGIGTSSPSTVLHLNDTTDPIIRLQRGGGVYSQVQSDGAGSLYLSADAGNTGSSSRMQFNVDGSEKMRIDSSGNVGIGTSSPEERLDLSDTFPQNLKLGLRGYLGQTYGASGTLLGHCVKAKTGGTTLEELVVTETNSGGGAPAAIYMSSGTIKFHTASSGTEGATFDSEGMRLESDHDLHVDGDVIAYSTTISDERLKDNIVGIDGALDKVSQLNGYTFNYKADGKVSAGVIAQEVEKVLPEAVSEKELPLKADDGEQYKVVNYDALHGLMIEAIKELTNKVNELEAKLENK
jgi:hypothetical protein